jgi:hypothetical protein
MQKVEASSQRWNADIRIGRRAAKEKNRGLDNHGHMGGTREMYGSSSETQTLSFQPTGKENISPWLSATLDLNFRAVPECLLLFRPRAKA